MIHFVVLTMICLSIIHWRIGKSLGYPPLVFTSFWAALLGLAAVSGDYRPISGMTLAVYFLGVVAFGIGGTLMVAAEGDRIRCSRPRIEDGTQDTVVLVILIFSVVMLPFFLRQIEAAGAEVGISNGVLAYRLLRVANGGQWMGIYAYVIALVTIAAVAAVVRDVGRRRWQIRTVLLFLMAVVYQTLSTSRTGMGILLFGFVGVFLISRGGLRPRAIIASIGIFVLLFVGVAQILHKTQIGGFQGANMVQDATIMLRHYAISGAVAFSTVVDQSHDIDAGSHLFRAFAALAGAFGYDTTVVPLVREFIWVPYPTNVYTMFYPVFVDFGLMGVVFYCLCLGMGVTKLFLWATRGSSVAIGLYAIAFTKILYSGMNEEFIMAASFWAQAMIIMALICGDWKVLVPKIVRADPAVRS